MLEFWVKRFLTRCCQCQILKHDLQEASSESFLVIMDVTYLLYTNIPHDEGLETLWQFLDLQV